jgi:hypothetical protein
MKKPGAAGWLCAGWIAAALALVFSSWCGSAKADDQIVSCGSVAIDYFDSGVLKDCREGSGASGQGHYTRQTMLITGRDYLLLIEHVRARADSYLETEDSTELARRLGRKLLQSTPSISGHEPVNDFDVAVFEGVPAANPQGQVHCFSFIGYLDPVPGGTNGNPRGYQTGIGGVYCAGPPDATSDDNIAAVLNNLRVYQN